MVTRLTQISSPEARKEVAINIELNGHEGIVRGKIVDAVVSDFGFTCSMDNVEERSKLKGTREYMAPEIYSLKEEEANGFPNDNWALGILSRI